MHKDDVLPYLTKQFPKNTTFKVTGFFKDIPDEQTVGGGGEPALQIYIHNGITNDFAVCMPDPYTCGHWLVGGWHRVENVNRVVEALKQAYGASLIETTQHAGLARTAALIEAGWKPVIRWGNYQHHVDENGLADGLEPHSKLVTYAYHTVEKL